MLCARPVSRVFKLFSPDAFTWFIGLAQYHSGLWSPNVVIPETARSKASYLYNSTDRTCLHYLQPMAPSTMNGRNIHEIKYSTYIEVEVVR